MSGGILSDPPATSSVGSGQRVSDDPTPGQCGGIQTRIGNHTFRATRITIYLLNGGTLEKAQQMAAHESPRTTKLYDRTNEAVSLDEVEKVVF